VRRLAAPSGRGVSDLHLAMGQRDDFLPNSALLSAALRLYYLPRRFTLVLNGTWRAAAFRLPEIRGVGPASTSCWNGSPAGRLERLVAPRRGVVVLRDSYPRRVCWRRCAWSGAGRACCCFTGTRPPTSRPDSSDWSPSSCATWPIPWASALVSLPLQPASLPVERRVYASPAGQAGGPDRHTHRPLFESLSKLDTLRFRIESLCRQIPPREQEQPALERELGRAQGRAGAGAGQAGRNQGGTLYTPAARALPVHPAAASGGAASRGWRSPRAASPWCTGSTGTAAPTREALEGTPTCGRCWSRKPWITCSPACAFLPETSRPPQRIWKNGMGKHNVADRRFEEASDLLAVQGPCGGTAMPSRRRRALYPLCTPWLSGCWAAVRRRRGGAGSSCAPSAPGRFRLDRRFHPWLYTIALNYLRTVARQLAGAADADRALDEATDAAADAASTRPRRWSGRPGERLPSGRWRDYVAVP